MLSGDMTLGFDPYNDFIHKQEVKWSTADTKWLIIAALSTEPARCHHCL